MNKGASIMMMNGGQTSPACVLMVQHCMCLEMKSMNPFELFKLRNCP